MDKNQKRLSCVTSFLLSFLVLLIHFIYIIDLYVGQIHLFDKNDTFNKQMFHLTLSAYWPLIQVLLVVSISYAVFSWIIYYFILFLRRVGVQKTGSIILTVRCWFVAYAAVVALNSYLFPNSAFSISLFSRFSEWPMFSEIFFYLSLIIAGIVLIGFFATSAEKITRKKSSLFFLLLLALILIGYRLFVTCHVPNSKKIREGYENKRPNVIMLVYCSFKANMFTKFPNFRDFAEHSIWFKNVLSPTARSAPSTFAILTGEYPTTSHFFENLSWRDSRINYDRSIAETFQKEGYQTMFMTNISLFRRLDSKLNWGFQDIISPPTSVYALVMSKFNDFPLTNLLFLFGFEKELFPLNYNNADDGVHYVPGKFLKEFNYVLNHRLQKKPLFLMLNDESLHYPYEMWQMRKQLSGGEKYEQLMGLADEQFFEYLVAMKKHGLLKNTILILTADHGEAQDSDPQINKIVNQIRKNPPKNIALLKSKLNGFEMLVGHGSYAMDKEQYHVPLIFHFYGNKYNIKSPQKNDLLNSTVDIVPTLVEILNLPKVDTDGISLVPYMRGAAEQSRVVYLNTGASIKMPDNWKEIQQLAYHMKQHYRITKTGEFGLRFDFLAQLKHKLSVAVYWKNFGLVYFPASAGYLTHLNLPGLFSLMNQTNFHTVLFTKEELEKFLINPNASTLNKLGMTTQDVAFLYSKLMTYHEKVLKSANEKVIERN